MKRYIVFIISLLAIGSLVYSQGTLQEKALKILKERGEVILEFERPPAQVLNELSRLISIDRVDTQSVRAYANTQGFYDFLAFNIPFRILDWPGKNFDSNLKQYLPVTSWQVYPTYEQYDSLMVRFQENHPELCQLDTIGYTQEGRSLLVVKISDHVAIDEAEPEFFYTSSIHGDETGGYVMMLRLIDYLLTQYGLDAQVTRLVDGAEIWINPLANPDGTYHGGNHTIADAIRYNTNAVDLNRNFPDPSAGPHPDGQIYQQETLAMMDFMQDRHFSMSANFHGGEEVVNYPWDTWQTRHADDDWFQFISHEYADTAQAYSMNYMLGFNDGITNGYDWYSITGGRQDYVTYFLHGRETTLEIDVSKITPESELDPLWSYNYRSMLNYAAQVLYGVHGFVTDADDAEWPVRASVTIAGHDYDSSRVYSAEHHGFYVRLLNEGTYNLTFAADGYVEQTITGVSVSNYQTTRLDVQLVKNASSVSPISANTNHVALFPNPARSFSTIRFLLAEEASISIRILDLNGRVRQQIQQENHAAGRFEKDINLESLNSGLYILQVYIDKQVIYRKLLKY